MPATVISHRFPQAMRLDKVGVSALLNNGIRLGGKNLSPIVAKLKQSNLSHGRVAISVPKRILKSSVERNRVKRAVRETFRQHQLHTFSVDILVNLSAPIDTHDPQSRLLLREVLAKLFTLVIKRLQQVA